MSRYYHIDNFILKELSVSTFSDLLDVDGTNGIYVIRIKISHENKYMIKIGKTSNLRERIYRHIDEFKDCGGEIILLFYGKSTNNEAEKYIHRKLRKFKRKVIITPFGKQSTEVYPINPRLIDYIEALYKKTCEIYYESQNYIINNNGKEHYLILKEIENDIDDYSPDYFEDNPQGYCYLGGYGDKYEEEFWNAIKKNFYEDEYQNSIIYDNMSCDDTLSCDDIRSSDDSESESINSFIDDDGDDGDDDYDDDDGDDEDDDYDDDDGDDGDDDYDDDDTTCINY